MPYRKATDNVHIYMIYIQMKRLVCQLNENYEYVLTDTFIHILNYPCLEVQFTIKMFVFFFQYVKFDSSDRDSYIFVS